MLFTRDRLWKSMRVGCLLALGACVSETTAPMAIDGATSSPARVSLSLRTVDGNGTADGVRDVWMGTRSNPASQVRVVDQHGSPVAGAAVRFLSRRVGQRASDSVFAIETTALSDGNGLATLYDVMFPVRDTVADVYVVTAMLVSDTTVALDSRVRAWRDVLRFGGNAPLVLSTMPVAMPQIQAILPLGTFNGGKALPSADAIVVPVEGPSPAVVAMTDGLVTEVNTADGEITLRVRDAIRVRLSGVELRSALWVGAVVREGDSLGTARPVTEQSPGVAVQVLDASVQRVNWIHPERYGARRNTAFFVQYLADAYRSEAFALVQRAAPDLSGTIDYDRAGRLVGTWFDPLAATTNGSAAALSTPPNLFLSSAQQNNEIDPTAALDGMALTFAYDAQTPGEIRVAVGSRLGSVLGSSGIRAVAWEDPDPALVWVATGLVRYHLYDRGGASRIGPPSQMLLVQLIDSEHLRVEVVEGNDPGTGFSARAVVLIR